MKLISVLNDAELTAAFCKLPSELYQEKDQKFAMNEYHCRKLISIPFPYEKEAFLIQNESGYIGRILLHKSPDSSLGHWSFLCLPDNLWSESDLMELNSLLDAWFVNRKITQVVGPYYFTTYFPYRMRVDEDSLSYPWEPKQPSYELKFMKKMGHEIHETYYTNFLDGFGDFGKKGKKELDQLLSEGYTFRSIDSGNLETEIKILYELSMKGFTDNYLFTPIPFELFKELYVPTFKAADLRMSCIQYSPEGKPCGFNFTFHEEDKAVIKSACVLPEFRGKGLFNAGICYGILKTWEIHPEVKDVITALVHDKNAASSHVADFSGKARRHEYALLKKDL
jgi:hypothetical protein